MSSASAPGKVILAGEHAVVYGRPAIAVPVWEVQAHATLHRRPAGSGCVIRALDTGAVIHLADAPQDEALALVARTTLRRLALPENPDWLIELTSEIPMASGLGSGAALSAALVRVLCAEADVPPRPELVSELVFASEQIYHGAPSGIDNTVVAYGRPIWFVKGQPPESFTPARPFQIAIADSGVPSPTKETVGAVRRRRELQPAQYEAWFDAIAEVVTAARAAIEQGEIEELGALFDENQILLQEIGVSAPKIDRLVEAARDAGAGGAKLSGGGGGGNMIALVERTTAAAVRAALLRAGARRVIVTTVGSKHPGHE